MTNNPKNQQGTIIIVILFIFAIATMITTELTYKQQHNVGFIGGFISKDQAYMFAIGGEIFGLQILMKDLEEDEEEGKKNDHLAEDWANIQGSSFELKINEDSIKAEGSVRVYIEELNNRFNVNNLIFSTNKFSIQQFQQTAQKLVEIINPDAPAADIVYALHDWLDADDNPRGNSDAETDYYEGLNLPYRAANLRMHYIEELKLIKGMEENDFQLFHQIVPRLTVSNSSSNNHDNSESSDEDSFYGDEGNYVNDPYATSQVTTSSITASDPSQWFVALPTLTKYNINTVSKNFLQQILPKAESESIDLIIENRGEEGYLSVPALNQTGLNSNQQKSIQQMFDVKSNFFQIISIAEIGGIKMSLLSIIQRPNKSTEAPKVILRDLSLNL